MIPDITDGNGFRPNEARRGTLGFLIFPKRNRSERDHVFINGFTTHYNLHLIKLAVFQSVVLDLETGCDLRICQLRRWTLGISFVAVMVRKSFRRTLTSMERKEPIPSGGKIGCIGERGVRSRQRLFQPRSHSVLNKSGFPPKTGSGSGALASKCL